MATTGAFGLDIGGSGIKGAPVDLRRGVFRADRFRLETPQPATPEAVGPVVAEVVAHFGHRGPLGATFPAVIKDGTAQTAANVDKSWIGTNVTAQLAEATGCQTVVLNDADAAGLAEARYGAARGTKGLVVLVTLGTGIGSAVIIDGRLVPNSELGHLEVDGHDAETRAADSARERESLSWEQWAKRVSHYLRALETVLWPDLIVCGGGVSKKADRWLPLLTKVRTPVVPAELRNDGGIIGAALYARETLGTGRGARRTVSG